MAAPTSGSTSGSQARPSATPIPTIPQTAPAGGIFFTQPPQTDAASFYKIAPNEPITFGWNMTSVIITPASLTVSAYCSDNGNTYPVGPTDGVIPGTATQVVWDPYGYEQAHPSEPLAVASYTLQIQDGHGFTQPPLPGRFSPNEQMTFALYRPQAYTPLSSWTCNGCSSATHAAAIHPIFLSLFATFVAIAVGGWGILRRRWA